MPQNRILDKMLDRLFASMVNGPSLNCRPHASRQRVDLCAFEAFTDKAPPVLIEELLSEDRLSSIAAAAPMPESLIRDKSKPPSVRFADADDAIDEEDDAPQAAEAVDGEEQLSADEKEKQREEQRQVRTWKRQKSLLTKLRNLSEDARLYEQDTGVHALNIGYPILSLPPGIMGGGSRRVLAPVAFIPVTLEVNAGRRPGVTLRCRGEGVDLITPNVALLAWLERETGQPAFELHHDEEGEDPWGEVRELIDCVCRQLELDRSLADQLVVQAPPPPTDDANRNEVVLPAADNEDAEQATTEPPPFSLKRTPLADDLPAEPALLPSAVLGLFPASNQGLLRDMREMIAEEALEGPVGGFIDVSVNLDAMDHEVPASEELLNKKLRQFDDERFVALADPFQANAVTKARSSAAMVIHGPPGTGKSQTITNIIGDHLARGQRVLFVCDKRTALDVVNNRMEHLGLGPLCAIVHDPQRDQRHLYMAIRGSLDELPDLKTPSRATSRLEKVDRELQSIHDELLQAHAALMAPPSDAPLGHSFHDLMGQWLAIDAPVLDSIDDAAMASVTMDMLEEHRRDIEVALERASDVDYAHNPWSVCAGGNLDAFLARPVDRVRQELGSCVEHARVADSTRDDSIPPFDPDADLAGQASKRVDLGERLDWIRQHTESDTRLLIAKLDASGLHARQQFIDEAATYRPVLEDGPLDRELSLSTRADMPPLRKINEDIGELNYYFDAMDNWWSWFAFGAKSAARKVLAKFGMRLSIDEAKRLHTFLTGLRARIVLSDLVTQMRGDSEQGSTLLSDEALTSTLEAFERLLAACKLADDTPNLSKPTRDAFADPDAMATLLDGLRKSPARVEALTTLEDALKQTQLFDATWLRQAATHFRSGRNAHDNLVRLEEKFDTLEGVLRVQDTTKRLPDAIRAGLGAVFDAAISPEQGTDALRREVLAGELKRRVAADPSLSRLDEQRLQHNFDRYAELEAQKRELVRDSIFHEWVSRQKKRLLVGTGSRLNSEGADLRRRLFVRGKRAMRLRQVINVGEGIEGGDPLFDMCPVWMASPETVAQVFPRRAVFDVVIFDEASQCRLEEALPVLTRAERVVIAGDPKQLPPTRFFEASISVSEDEELETDQDLFEAQQGEVEDLLCAALNLQVEEAYLDVHYRSRNADLIEFSNEQFYHSRLQAIPGHPSARTQFPPLSLVRAEGIYEDRCNRIEAERVVQIVDDLLRRAEPPSVGIACFNLKQRDLIVDMLDDRALEDEGFAKRLAKARSRIGDGSFEGLFVKNLENVQGDERDHIIISTTYGPNQQGKFYRRFGPLGRAGGGRRLNVLVTRARHEVHLVTSIPRDAYMSIDNVPQGMSPTGAWLLFAYLRYAEELAELYEKDHAQYQHGEEAGDARLIVREVPPTSPFAMALATQVAREHGIGSDTHWGNEGFCVDAALHHPKRAEDVTIGLLTDFARFEQAPDPIEWEVYRTGILKWTGWTLQRVWTPSFFRDPQRELKRIAEASAVMAEAEQPSED